MHDQHIQKLKTCISSRLPVAQAKRPNVRQVWLQRSRLWGRIALQKCGVLWIVEPAMMSCYAAMPGDESHLRNWCCASSGIQASPKSACLINTIQAMNLKAMLWPHTASEPCMWWCFGVWCERQAAYWFVAFSSGVVVFWLGLLLPLVCVHCWANLAGVFDAYHLFNISSKYSLNITRIWTAFQLADDVDPFVKLWPGETWL